MHPFTAFSPADIAGRRALLSAQMCAGITKSQSCMLEDALLCVFGLQGAIFAQRARVNTSFFTAQQRAALADESAVWCAAKFYIIYTRKGGIAPPERDWRDFLAQLHH